jgi:3-methyladenine DNA glycosylase/8-oxoguanine DNA glycosylase
MQLHLSARPPFNLHSVVFSHGWIQMAPFEQHDPGFCYTLRLATGRVIFIEILEAPGGVRVDIPGEITPAEQAELTQTVAWMLDLDQDFSSFYARAQNEPKLAGVAQKAKGRILRSPTIFEDVIKTILTTNTLWAATLRMNKNLVTQFGDPLPGDSERKAFPASQALAQVDEATFRVQTRLGYRAPYLVDLSRRVASGELDLEALKTADLNTLELRSRLLEILGIGPYASANLLMLLGHYDFIPVDSWALKMVSHEWHQDASIGKKEVEAAFADWGEWKGLAYWMWDWSYNHEQK